MHFFASVPPTQPPQTNEDSKRDYISFDSASGVVRILKQCMSMPLGDLTKYAQTQQCWHSSPFCLLLMRHGLRTLECHARVEPERRLTNPQALSSAQSQMPIRLRQAHSILACNVGLPSVLHNCSQAQLERSGKR